MSYLGITGLVNFITSTILGVAYLIKITDRPLRYTTFLANFSIAIFSLGYLFWQLSTDAEHAFFWFKILTLGIILINTLFLHFVFVFVGIAQRKKIEIIFYYAISGFFIFLNLNSMLFTTVEPRHNLGFWPIPTQLFNIYLTYWWWQCIYGYGWLIHSLRNSKGFIREQRKYLALGLLVAFIGGASNWPMWYGINFPPYLNILISLYVLLSAYAIIKFRLMDIKVILTRAGIFLFLYTFILGLPLLIGYRNGFNFDSFLLLFILATVGPVIYQFLQRKAEDVLLAKQRNYQNMFLQASKEFLRERDLERIIRIIVYGVKYQINVEYAGFFLVDRDTGYYRLHFIKGEHHFPRNYSIEGSHELIQQLKDSRRVLTYNEISGFIHTHVATPVQLIVPSFLDDSLLAFLIMGEKVDKSFYTQDDISTFEIIAHQSALAIENCLYFEERERVQERLFQTEKSAFIGGMAEGVAHQINNRLNHFSLTATEIDMHLTRFEEGAADLISKNKSLGELFATLHEIRKQLLDNVKRTNGVIKGVLNYANLTRRDDDSSEIFFDELINAAIDLAQVKHEIEKFPIKLEVIGSSNIIYGKMTQLLEAVFNILDNAYEAIEEKRLFKLSEEERKQFKPGIEITLIQTETTSMINISDNGIGIEDEDKQKIFAPYYTTKSSYKTISGSGIGLYEVSRFITEGHSGKIWFESTYMSGTTFHIEIPRVAQDHLNLS